MSIYSSFFKTSPLVTFMHAFITDIDYVHWQACEEEICCHVIENVLKIYVNVTCTIQKTRDTSVIYE